jgi:23S rRNA pseudouridine1911/1915/1917 synthase
MKKHCFVVKAVNSGRRLDAFVAHHLQFAALSRTAIKNLIDSNKIQVNSQQKKASYRLSADDIVNVSLPPVVSSELVPEEVFFRPLFEDDDLIVLSKPPGLVVHPACGHSSGTLVHGLLYHCRNLSGIGGEQRPGIVHRLDKDTSGVMIVAKNDMAHQSLSCQFKERNIKKIYLALLAGSPPADHGTVDLPIGRHPVQRKKMTVRRKDGREAITHWQVIESFSAYTLVKLRLDTGRTHQIRVHMAALGCPVAGDAVYGGKQVNVPVIKRQCLHAWQLSFNHPRSRERQRIVAPLWEDIVMLLKNLGSKVNGLS